MLRGAVFVATISKPENADFGFGHFSSFLRHVYYDFLTRIIQRVNEETHVLPLTVL